MKKFSVWDSAGVQTFVEADSVTVKKKKDGIHLKFKIGGATLYRKACTAVTETTPPFVLK